MPSTSAPPELPGFSAASVWITSSIIRVVPPSRAGSERPERRHHARGHRPGEAVRVADRDDELPDPQQSRVAQLRRGSDTDSVRSSARSDSGSTPTTEAATSTPEVNDTRTTRPPEITCAFVSMNPSA